MYGLIDSLEQREDLLEVILNQRRKCVNPLFDNENIKASRLNAFSVDECVLYFDQNNPELQELIKMDYFDD